MPDLKSIKQLLISMIVMILLSLGMTGYGVVRNEVSNREFAERITQESQQRETQLSAKLDTNLQRQILGLRENFISWQIDQIAQSRKFVALEVATQLKQSQVAK